MPIPSSEAAAAAVVTALNTAGLGITFTRARWPKYALKDIAATKAHVVAVWPARMEVTDQGGTTETETPLGITIDRACEKTNTALVDELTTLLETIATTLGRTDVPDLGFPAEPLVIDINVEMLDQGHFCGGVGAVYKKFRGYDE